MIRLIHGFIWKKVVLQELLLENRLIPICFILIKYGHVWFGGYKFGNEIILINGVVQEIHYTNVSGRVPLDTNELRFFQEIVSVKADEIVSKWIDFFVLHKSIASERITRRLK